MAATALLASDAVIRTNLRTLGRRRFHLPIHVFPDTLLKGGLSWRYQIPWDAAGTISGYEKFRLRKSIDFAVVARIHRYVLDDGVITDARMTLGAVAPVPLEKEKGGSVSDWKETFGETALGAAKLALEGRFLSGNAYKIDVAGNTGTAVHWTGAGRMNKEYITETALKGEYRESPKHAWGQGACQDPSCEGCADLLFLSADGELITSISYTITETSCFPSKACAGTAAALVRGEDLYWKPTP